MNYPTLGANGIGDLGDERGEHHVRRSFPIWKLTRDARCAGDSMRGGGL
jgi:hypothetical protein